MEEKIRLKMDDKLSFSRQEHQILHVPAFTDENSVTETVVILDLDSINDIVTSEGSAKETMPVSSMSNFRVIKIYIAI